MRDTIEIAREAGFELGKVFANGVLVDATTTELKAFEALVRADALASIDPSKFMSYQEGFEAGRLAEREACAKLCEARSEEEIGMAYEGIALDCAEAIRARGNA